LKRHKIIKKKYIYSNQKGDEKVTGKQTDINKGESEYYYYYYEKAIEGPGDAEIASIDAYKMDAWIEKPAWISRILAPDASARLLDHHYTNDEYDLMRRIIEDFSKIYLDMAKVILKAKGAYKDNEPLRCTIIDYIDEFINYYFSIKKRIKAAI